MSTNDIHVPDFLMSMWDNRYWWLSVTGGLAGAFWWWLTTLFPTYKDMEACKKELFETLDEHQKWETAQREKSEKVSADQWKEVNREIGELKNLLIRQFADRI